MLLSKCAVSDSKKSQFIKKSKASGLLSNIGITTPFSKNPLSADVLFSRYKIVNNFLLAGDKVMTKMHLKQPGFTYSGCVPFIKTKKRIQQFKETRDSR